MRREGWGDGEKEEGESFKHFAVAIAFSVRPFLSLCRSLPPFSLLFPSSLPLVCRRKCFIFGSTRSSSTCTLFNSRPGLLKNTGTSFQCMPVLPYGAYAHTSGVSLGEDNHIRSVS